MWGSAFDTLFGVSVGGIRELLVHEFDGDVRGDIDGCEDCDSLGDWLANLRGIDGDLDGDFMLRVLEVLDGVEHDFSNG